MSKNPWIKLANGNRVLTRLVAAVYTHEGTYRIFLKGDKGDILCTVQHDNDEDFRKDLDSINEQLG